VEYYAKLERGSLSGASPAVLDALANALRLDPAERAYLNDLADVSGRAGRVRQSPRRPTPWIPHPSLQWTLDAIVEGAAFVCDNRQDIVAANALARAFYSQVYDTPANKNNLALYTFLDPRARDFFTEWEAMADICVSVLRTNAGRDPHNKGIHDLVGELSTRSDEFRRRWAAHNVRHHGTGTKRFHHPLVGAMDLAYEGMQLVADPTMTFTVYTAEPGSPSHDALRLLFVLAATPTPASSATPAPIEPDIADRR
jgi:hypothetical protein